MDKKDQKINSKLVKVQVTNTGDLPSEETKRSIKNMLGRTLMITEFGKKNKEIIEAKDKLYDTFCTTGFFDSQDANHLFRLYADKDKDIVITKAHLLAKYIIRIPGVPEEESIKLTHYIKILRFIRNGLNPIMYQIKSFVSHAKTYAEKKINIDGTNEVYSIYDSENEKLAEHDVAKNYLKKIMMEKGYDGDRFDSGKAIISGCFQQNNYQNLMIFALLGFHYFDRKHEVYDAFTPEELKDIIISFDMPGFRSTSIPLGTFLKIIEHLDFKKLFSV